MGKFFQRASPGLPTAEAGLREREAPWSAAGLRVGGGKAHEREDPSFIPAREYSADERAERARGAVIALLLAAALIVLAVALGLLISVS